MKKSDITRQMIVEKAAQAFNLYGFGNTSMSKLMEVTGLEKGGIYGHFASKEELAIEAFDYAFTQSMTNRLNSAQGMKTNAKKIEYLFKTFATFDQGIAGGCPTFNTAVESMNGSPILKERALVAYNAWINEITKLINGAIKEGSYRKVKSKKVAAFLLHSLEGAIIATSLTKDIKYVNDMCDELLEYIEWKCVKEL